MYMWNIFNKTFLHRLIDSSGDHIIEVWNISGCLLMHYLLAEFVVFRSKVARGVKKSQQSLP